MSKSNASIGRPMLALDLLFSRYRTRRRRGTRCTLRVVAAAGTLVYRFRERPTGLTEEANRVQRRNQRRKRVRVYARSRLPPLLSSFLPGRVATCR